MKNNDFFFPVACRKFIEIASVCLFIILYAGIGENTTGIAVGFRAVLCNRCFSALTLPQETGNLLISFSDVFP